MPSNETAKTKWAPRRLAWIILLCILAGLVGYIAVASSLQRTAPASEKPAGSKLDGKKYTLVAPPPEPDNAARLPQVHGKSYRLTAVASYDAQVKGLSGTDRLADNAGMLFWYDETAERCFWMKDMRYSLDIIWLDAQKKVVHVEPELAPNTYPNTYCAQARYVIELNAGQAAGSGITKGQVLSF